MFTIFAINSPFLLPSFLGRKRKREKNNKSSGQKSCLSARSLSEPFLLERYRNGTPLVIRKSTVYLYVIGDRAERHCFDPDFGYSSSFSSFIGKEEKGGKE